MAEFVTYLWLREDGTPYYAGKGKIHRAFEPHRVGDAPSKERIILQNWPSEHDAFEAEKALIAFYGRKDLGTGCLRNLTDGGEGTSGRKATELQIQSSKRVGRKHVENGVDFRALGRLGGARAGSLRPDAKNRLKKIGATIGLVGAHNRWHKQTMNLNCSLCVKAV